MKETKNQNEYFSIKETRREKLLVRGSKFIATVIPISYEEEAKTFLERIRKEFHDADHNPFAYILTEGGILKSGDDREPQGTAGRQILSVIQSQNLKDILIVVTRYFGGVKLGKGGLSRAYYESTLKVLKNCTLIKKELREKITIIFPNLYFDQVQRVLNRGKIKVKKLTFGDRVKMEIDLNKATSSKLKEELKNSSRGEIEFEPA